MPQAGIDDGEPCFPLAPVREVPARGLFLRPPMVAPFQGAILLLPFVVEDIGPMPEDLHVEFAPDEFFDESEDAFAPGGVSSLNSS